MAEGNFDLPAGARFNPQKLERISEFFRKEVADGKIPGAIVLIPQHGKPVYFEKFGVRDDATKEPMTDDTIFRHIFDDQADHQVAAMMLVDEGKLRLDDPVSKYIPAFADAKVGVELKAENGERKLELEPLERPITIQDLMRHTSGITYGFYGESLVQQGLCQRLDLFDGDFDNAEFAERIARCRWPNSPERVGVRPFDRRARPGDRGRSGQVAACSSKSERLFDPLGMKDTAFYVTEPDQAALIAEPLPADARSGPAAIKRAEDDEMGVRRRRHGVDDRGLRALCADDFNGGMLDGRRYLSPRRFKLMASNHIGPQLRRRRATTYIFPATVSASGSASRVRIDQGTPNRRRRARSAN